jgi:hypothetical protein
MKYEQALATAEFIKSKYAKPIEVALILGSGLGAFADDIENAVKIPYEEIPNFSRSTVEGHAGQLVLGEINGVSVAVQQGRFHYYEGYDSAGCFACSHVWSAWNQKIDYHERRRKRPHRAKTRHVDADSRPFEYDGNESVDWSKRFAFRRQIS